MVKQLETVKIPAAKNVLGCPNTTSTTVLRKKLGMYQHEANRDK